MPRIGFLLSGRPFANDTCLAPGTPGTKGRGAETRQAVTALPEYHPTTLRTKEFSACRRLAIPVLGTRDPCHSRH